MGWGVVFAALVLGDINTLGFCLTCRNKMAGLDSGRCHGHAEIMNNHSYFTIIIILKKVRTVPVSPTGGLNCLAQAIPLQQYISYAIPKQPIHSPLYILVRTGLENYM